MQAIEVSCNLNCTGYVPGNISFKAHEEIKTLSDFYSVKSGRWRIPIVNFSGGMNTEIRWASDTSMPGTHQRWRSYHPGISARISGKANDDRRGRMSFA